MAVGDFNADGNADLAGTYIGGDLGLKGFVSVRLGDGAGGFGSRTSYEIGRSPETVVAADMNKDGDPDLVVVNEQCGVVPEHGSIAVLFGQVGGDFAPPVAYEVGGFPRGLAVGEFNSDGKPDVAVTNVVDDESTVSVLLGRTGGTLGPPHPYPVEQFSPGSVAIGFFNADDDPDLVTANDSAHTVSVLLGQPGGAFSPQTSYPVGAQYPTSVAVGDLDDDGDSDLAVNGSSSQVVSVLPGDGSGAFGPPSIHPTGGRAPLSVVAGDLNGDGIEDLAVADFLDDIVSVLLGTGGGDFAPPASFPAGSDSYRLAIGEFNSDGAPDLTIGTAVLLNTPVLIDPTEINFDERPNHTTRPDHTESPRKTITLTNVSAPDLAVSAVEVDGADAASFPLSSETCTGATLATEERCTLQVRFRPLGTGPMSATIRFSDSGGDTPPQTVRLSGKATPGPWLEPSAQGLRFGKQSIGTTSAKKTVTLTNVGSDRMAINKIALTGANPGDFHGLTQTCTAMLSLDPGQSCTASVAFRPTAIGARSARLTITDTAPRSPHQVGLTGTGT